ncbi:hypothetical protein SAJA_14950 [Salinisphaera japonica YTM-1]|uniref:Uncharacterized protein n=1 Tax=Salinisphaera japonica YTM-1 TaxID=1209778 RepID=A0A423PE50_9GAMM|nr:hypothetical protein SAJA_14950 [Salinisphaera japonica YTM-1]
MGGYGYDHGPDHTQSAVFKSSPGSATNNGLDENFRTVTGAMTMARHGASTAGLVLAGVLVSLAACAASPDSESQQQAWPNGAGPAAATSQATSQASPGGEQTAGNATGETARRTEADRYQPWTTPDGVHMLRVAPSASPHLSVRRCDDGRLVAAERGPGACTEH